MPGARITILTDFGTADGYVGAMKGVIASISPESAIDDVAHDLPAGDVIAASWALSGYWRLFPAGTVHLVVVDPGVGSSRRALAACFQGRLIVAPDNGVISRLLQESAPEWMRELRNDALFRTSVSATFHGRDIFAPVAAHLARGADPESLGPQLGSAVRLPFREAARRRDGVYGRWRT